MCLMFDENCQIQRRKKLLLIIVQLFMSRLFFWHVYCSLWFRFRSDRTPFVRLEMKTADSRPDGIHLQLGDLAMLDSVQASAFGNYPFPADENLSSSVLKSINESNTERVSDRLELSRLNSNIPGPPEIPPEEAAVASSLENLILEEEKGLTPTPGSLIQKDVRESLFSIDGGERGGNVNQRV